MAGSSEVVEPPVASVPTTKRQFTLDEVEEMASNGTLGQVLDDLGFPQAFPATPNRAKRRIGAGTPFDRATFDPAAYEERTFKDG